ncbi:MAG: hypothetical protein R6W67_03540, partial [Bacteroidales bacterium]
ESTPTNFATTPEGGKGATRSIIIAPRWCAIVRGAIVSLLFLSRRQKREGQTRVCGLMGTGYQIPGTGYRVPDTDTGYRLPVTFTFIFYLAGIP